MKEKYHVSAKRHQELKLITKELQQEADVWKGKELVWARGRYKGRKCLVSSATFDEWTGEILVVTDTYRQDGKGFVVQVGSRFYLSLANFIT